jgi:hypothetical protein
MLLFRSARSGIEQLAWPVNTSLIVCEVSSGGAGLFPNCYRRYYRFGRGSFSRFDCGRFSRFG